MTRTRAHRTTATLVTLWLVIATGCGGALSVEPTGQISVRNVTADSIAVTIFEREDAYRVDPVPERSAAEERDRLILPGGQRQVELSQIYGYRPGKDIRIFLYRIRQARSVFVGVRDVSAASLRASGYTVEIRASEFPP